MFCRMCDVGIMFGNREVEKVREILIGIHCLRKFIIYHLPAIAYAVGIIALSSIPRLKTPELEFIAVDKVAHFIEYAVFSFLTFRSLSHLDRLVNTNYAFWIAALFLAAFAWLDETYQRLIPGRHAHLADFLTDVLGALLVLLLLWFRSRKRHRRSQLS